MKKHHKMHHSDPIVGGESERESRPLGHGHFANMPTEVMMKEYPKNHYEMDEVLDDTAGRLQSDAKQATVGERKNLSRGMY